MYVNDQTFFNMLNLYLSSKFLCYRKENKKALDIKQSVKEVTSFSLTFLAHYEVTSFSLTFMARPRLTKNRTQAHDQGYLQDTEETEIWMVSRCQMPQWSAQQKVSALIIARAVVGNLSLCVLCFCACLPPNWWDMARDLHLGYDIYMHSGLFVFV